MSVDEFFQNFPVPFRLPVNISDRTGVRQKVLEFVDAVDAVTFPWIGEVFGICFRWVVGEDQCRYAVVFCRFHGKPFPHFRIGPHSHEYETDTVQNKRIVGLVFSITEIRIGFVACFEKTVMNFIPVIMRL